jgi:hypothetical protein
MKSTQLLALCGLFATQAPLVAQDATPRADQSPPGKASSPEERRDQSPAGRASRPDGTRHREPGPERREDRRQHRPEGGERARFGEMRRVSYLGVLTSPVSPDARAHLGLKEGFGLRIAEVQRGSPAEAAGLKENDVLVRLEDQRLASMEQLQALVRERRKGEQVKLLVISAGKETEVTVEVGETSVPANPEPRGPRFLPPMGLPRLPGEMREHWEHHRRALEDWQEKRRDSGAPPPPAPSREKAGEQRRSGESRGVSTVTRSDDSGIYTLSRNGDRHIFTAQPREGESSVWDLREGRERIPEPLREKLRQLEEIRGDREENRIRESESGRNKENDPRDRN